MEPGVGLLHLATPIWFFNKGDFVKDDNVDQFVEWCKVAGENFGDLATMFTTMTEPNWVAKFS